ncbi:structural maintenance of chromosomes protein [Phanerochaete sordida]|uniref:Structural maintenance of chromosomes protein 5 n=1 Tax=Phanerochaete sordida TaxID=48140 RepID=A0A9P3LB59_9APHY|nr:structural maintenance of chromosomes protein [Phanerochaete sordida]
MVRKATSPSSAGSHKENAGVAAREQTKAAKNRGGRRAGRVESDDEEDGPEPAQDHDENAEDEGGEEDEDEEDGEGSPKGRKRARVNTEGDARPVDLKGKGKAEPKTLPRDEDGFLPGSIVRVQLRNFVTYDYVEFTPGPYLNMILGPNGTGKSSIACAICLGLNFPPSVLGRAAELNSFVKLGQKDGHIEIELKGAKGKPNLVIKRTLSAHSKVNSFTINGEPASGKEINSRMQELNVQVNNLCSFLPQDKVAEFARMNPQQLLKETQRAAGNANLSAWHETLTEAGKEYKQMKERLDDDRAQLKTMEERNANLERDVKKYEERQRIESEIHFLELLLPFKEYIAAKDLYDIARARQRKLHERVKKLKAKNEPILSKQRKLQEDQARLEKDRDRRKLAAKAKFGTMRAKWDENTKLEQSAEDLKTKLDNIKKDERTRVKKIQDLQKMLGVLQEKLNNPPEFEDVDQLASQISAFKAEGRAIQSKLDELQQKLRDQVEEQVKYKREADEYRSRLQQLDNADAQKLDSLVRWHRDTGETVKWLRENQHRFKMPILEPPMLSCTVPNRQFVNSVEALFGPNDLQCFVAQCEEDYRLLNRLVADTGEALGRRARINSWFRDPHQISPPPVSSEQLRELGFDGYALDFVQCPDGIKWYLQSVMQLHRAAICLDPRRVDPQRAMDALSRDGNVTYLVGNVTNQVRRSRYGKRLAQNSTREFGEARRLVAAAVDPSVKENFERSMREAREKAKSYDETINDIHQEESQRRKEYGDVKKKWEALTAVKEKSQQEQVKFQRLGHTIKQKEDELKRLQNAPSPEAERAKLKQQLLKIAQRRVQIVMEYQKNIRQVIEENTEMVRTGLQFLQISANRREIERLCEERTAELNKAQEEWKQAYEVYMNAKADVVDRMDASKAKLDAAGEETRQRFLELEESGKKDDRTVEVLHHELGTLRAQLDMNMQTNAGVVEQFRKRQAEIATLTETIAEREEKLEKAETRIQRTRALWEPALRDLVDSIGERFSAAFDRIGCAGEVRIAEHEDFDRWAIDILVKFRDDEKLQLLTAERQSGGERSLTTILYLMSLTSHARAPFSLVDEINQGMDARAERAVHNSLVDVTCKVDAGQYFLITPKLLPDLNYHERMKVLCVNNGEWLPDEAVSGNLMGMIDTFVRTRGSA